MGIPGGASGKESACNAEDAGDVSWILESKIPCGRKGQPTPVFLPRKFHGQKSLAGYNPWGQEK